MQRKFRGFRLDDDTVAKVERMRRVLGLPNKNQVVAQVINEAYERMRASEQYAEALRALEIADEKLKEGM